MSATPNYVIVRLADFLHPGRHRSYHKLSLQAARRKRPGRYWIKMERRASWPAYKERRLVREGY